MQTKFMTNGASVHVLKINEDQITDKLSAGVYEVDYNDIQGFYLNIIKKKLELPSKIYGKTSERVERCFQTYKERSSSTGVLLTGDKGTGKTLLTSLLANKVIEELGLPVILIKQAYSGSQFTSFLTSLEECCIIFDEFGKMYNAGKDLDEGEDLQSSLLSLLDGVDKTKRLFILTENRESDINEFLLNRPSRLYYHFKYSKLDEDGITDYCSDFNIPPSILEDILDLSRRSRIFSFDILQTIIEELTRFGDSLTDLVTTLNIDSGDSFVDEIEIMQITDKDGEGSFVLVSSKITRESSYIYFKWEGGEKETDIYLRGHHLVYARGDTLVYEVDGYKVITKKVPYARLNYSSLAV